MSDELKFLHGIEPGSYPCRRWWQFWKRGGWIAISREQLINGNWFTHAMWTSGRDTHHPLIGNAVSVGVDSNGNLVEYQRAALSMFLKYRIGSDDVRFKGEGERVAHWIASVLREANP